MTAALRENSVSDIRLSFRHQGEARPQSRGLAAPESGDRLAASGMVSRLAPEICVGCTLAAVERGAPSSWSQEPGYG